MICPNQSNRDPLEKKENKKKEENNCGPLPPADPSGPVEKYNFPIVAQIKKCIWIHQLDLKKQNIKQLGLFFQHPL